MGRRRLLREVWRFPGGLLAGIRKELVGRHSRADLVLREKTQFVPRRGLLD